MDGDGLFGSGAPIGSVVICSPALVSGAASPHPRPFSAPVKPTLTGMVVLPEDWSAVTLTVSGAEIAIARRETGRCRVVAPLVSVSAPKAYLSSPAVVACAEMVSCWVAPGAMSNPVEPVPAAVTLASKPGTVIAASQWRGPLSTDVTVRAVESVPATFELATDARLRSLGAIGCCPSWNTAGSCEST